jgi:hypothetical protein
MANGEDTEDTTPQAPPTAPDDIDPTSELRGGKEPIEAPKEPQN